MLLKNIFLYGLIIELGMSLISAFPVDTITPMFFMHINPDALLCLLVLVKKKESKGKIVTLLSCAASGPGAITLLVLCFF